MWIRASLCCLTLAACGPESPSAEPVPEPMPKKGAEPCPLDRYEPLIGAPVSQADFTPGMNLRVIGPDTMVTMDHVPERLNVHVDAKGIVLGLSCG